MNNTNHHPLTLISHKLCPYVQRTVIALEELGLDYQRIDINLDSPPEWFLTLSPLGKVPLLVVDNETLLFESAVIAEFVNERGAGKLLAMDLLQRARQRAWIEFASATLDNIGALYSAREEKGFDRVVGQLDARWRQLEAALSGDGFFDGKTFTLVDVAFAPVFRYIDLFENLLERDFLEEFPRILQWRQVLAQRASVAKAVRRDYPTLLLEFLGKRDSWLGERVRDLLAGQFAA